MGVSRTGLPLLFTLAVLVVADPLARAQVEPDFNVRWQPILIPKEFEEIVRRLEFRNPDGEVVCRFLYDQFISTFNDRVKVVQAEIERVGRERNEWGERHGWQETPPARLDYIRLYDAWDAERDLLDEEFLEQIDPLMEPHQMRTWRAATRAMRRKRLLQNAATLGIRRAVDLKAVIEGLGIDTDRDATLAAAAAMYEEQIDAALTLFRRQYDEHRVQPAPPEVASMERDSPELINYLYDAGEERQRLVYRVEDVARIHLEALAQALGPDEPEFREAAYSAIYAEVFRESPAERLMLRLLELELDASLEARVDEIDSQYAPAQHNLRHGIASAWERWDTIRSKIRLYDRMRELAVSKSSMNGLADLYPDRDLWRRSRRLVHDTCKRLRDLFSDEEFEDLPADVRLLLSW